MNTKTLEKTNEADLKSSNIIIFELSEIDNSYKQITIEEFMDKFSSIKTKAEKNVKSINCGSLEIKTDSSEVYKNGLKINLSKREYRLLYLFASNTGKLLTSEQIINCIWGVAYANTGMLRVAIRRLRCKIDPDNKCLKTIRGRGYIFTNNYI